MHVSARHLGTTQLVGFCWPFKLCPSSATVGEKKGSQGVAWREGPTGKMKPFRVFKQREFSAGYWPHGL